MLTRPLPAEPRTVVLVSVLGLISYNVPVILPSGVAMYPGFPLLMCVLYCYGAAAANLAVIHRRCSISSPGNAGSLTGLFNAGQFILCIYATDMVGRWLGWVPGVRAAAKDILPAFLMMVTHDFLNVLFG